MPATRYSLAAKSARVEKEEESFTTTDAKNAEYKKSFDTKDTKVTTDYKRQLEDTASVVSGAPVFPYASLSAAFANLGCVLVVVPWRSWRPLR